ncbi:ATP-binding protein [Streptococcus parauberis]|uniref:ATP-binding protein n=1 Tax=Streptococcus parauberis TaxID=1348 RepID=UPI00374CE2D2
MSNSWDADSHKVNIQINYNEKYIIVEDDRISMTSTELNDNFLTITKNRRLSDQNDGVQFGLSKGERKVTGKKD